MSFAGGDRMSLSTELKTLALERLDRLRALDFTALSEVQPEPLQLTGRWGAKGSMWSDVARIGPDTLRVVVLWGVTTWWWPSYHHAFDGFRIHRDGKTGPLTQADGYELD